ncbi:ATP-binding protein [Nitrospira sp. Kam-Ns4a]
MPRVLEKSREWWSRLRVHQKLVTILLVIFVPLITALVIHFSFVTQLRAVQAQHHQIVLAREQLQVLRRLAVDIEDAFRGYLLTRQDAFLRPLQEAEPKVQPTVDRIMSLVESDSELAGALRSASGRLASLVESKHVLIEQVRANRTGEVLAYVRSGQGLALSDAVLNDFRRLEDRLDDLLQGYEAKEASLVNRAFWGILLTVAGALGLGLLYVRLLSRSITGPLTALQATAAQLNAAVAPNGTAARGRGRPGDELEELARVFEEMASRIQAHLREIDALTAIGNEINTIRADGVPGVLRRITDRACELLNVDVCLVMLRNDKMGCWVVEAASGEWHDRLYKSVMLWEEFPVSVQAYETGQPAFGDNLRDDTRPEVRRRNLIGQSMLSIPLLSQDKPFGVLVLLQSCAVSHAAWNVQLARGFASEAAIAIANARLYEALAQKGKGLETRLKQLEHLAVTLAHDMKGPGERIGGLAAAMLAQYGDRLDDRAKRWLRLMDEEGRELSTRIENILELARVGVGRESLEVVDPAVVLADVLKERAGELEQRKVRVHTPAEFPAVVCHRAYLRQVLDNLISNAIKFAGEQSHPQVRITVSRNGPLVRISVSDNGPGIPPQHRERVFEPFVRLRPDGAKGSGIGLAIVKRIVEMYGGAVSVEPSEQPGCTVAFTLPAAVELVGIPTTARPGPSSEERHQAEDRHDEPDV